MWKIWLYIAYILLLLTVEILDIVLLRKSIKTIDEAKEDDVITDEEKEVIKYNSWQAVICTLITVLGVAMAVIFIINTIRG